MAKRFTDTNKYKKPFLRSLPMKYKLLWDYILCDCDQAGLWIADFEIAQIYLGKDAIIEKHEALEYFNKNDTKVVPIKNSEYWFIPSFIEFQYGNKLSKTNNVYSSIEKILAKYNLFQFLTVEITEEGETKSSFRNRISKKIRQKIFLEDNLTCQYCDEQKSQNELVIDHIIPLENGGTNEDINLITSCIRCNSHKTDIDPEIFLSKSFDFLNPTEKLKERIKILKAPFNNLKGGKDKEKDKDQYNDMDMDKDILVEKLKKEFYSSLIDFHPEFSKEVLDEFFDYWSEPNKSKTKIKWQMEKTWDTHKRLLRWVRNDFGKKEQKQMPRTIFRDKNDW